MNGKILVADDEPAVQRIIARLARDLGCEVVVASDGGEAVIVAVRERPAVIFMDLHMPELDGLEALRTILEADPAARVIVVTGDGAPLRAAAAMESGAVGFMAKPFDLSALRQTMADHLLLAQAGASA
ncbi:MAG: response regulator [Elusimicrobiota bacterium]|jgi:CheY-like chemotaxis protein